MKPSWEYTIIETWIAVAGLCLVVAGIGYIGVNYHKTSGELKTVHNELETTTQTLNEKTLEFDRVTSELQDEIAKLTHELGLTEQEKTQLSETLQNAKGEIETLAEKTDELSETVDTYKKLNELDPQLLQKYSKVYFLNENYTPTGLSDIDKQHLLNTTRSLQIHAEVEPFLYDLLRDMADEELDVAIASAYRSFGTQESLKSAYRVTYGTTAANRFSADQGYSEHQLGTTVDLTTRKSGNLSTSFEKTPEFTWLTEHAHEYGFTLSYPKNNKYYIYEPWHWRFVGIELATDLHDDNKHLYDMDQRDIDEYLLQIFDEGRIQKHSDEQIVGVSPLN